MDMLPGTISSETGAMLARNLLILCYHSISDARRDALAVTVNSFRKQMVTLRNRGYQTITLADLVGKLDDNEPIPSKTLVITFDDGYRDVYLNAYPVLEVLGLRATVFLVTDLVNTKQMLYPQYYIKRFGGQPSDYRVLGWGEIREMADYGIEFGSHTCTHANLPTLSSHAVQRELVESKRLIEKQVSQPVVSFCYPEGLWSRSVIALLDSAGYQCAVVTPNAASLPMTRFSLERVSVYRSTNRWLFEFKISRAYRMLTGSRLFWGAKHVLKEARASWI